MQLLFALIPPWKSLSSKRQSSPKICTQMGPPLSAHVLFHAGSLGELELV
jgi:hypothetical protein